MRLPDDERSQWRLLPSEEVLWRGRPAPVARDRMWVVLPLLLFAVALVTVLFASLLQVVELEGVHRTVGVAALLAAAGVASLLVPKYLFDDCAYLITDRRVLWRRGRMVRSLQRRDLSYGRIRWHRASPVVGHLELVVAVPFGPLQRRLRILLHDVREPDRVLAIIRGHVPADHAGDRDVALADRLDQGEEVVWGGHPHGSGLGWREHVTTLIGLAITILGLLYGYRNASFLMDLENLGLAPRSMAWGLLFSAVCISCVCILTTGLAAIWHGAIRSRRLARDTEYIVTSRRVLIRRGDAELSVDRKRIVDVATQTTWNGLCHLFLVLDAPGSKSFADSGALKPLLPAREPLVPVLFELRDPTPARDLLLHATSD